MEKLVEMLKNDVRVVVTVVVAGVVLTLGWARGCTVSMGPAPVATPAPAEEPAKP